MKRFGKLTAVVLVAVLALTVLASCGGVSPVSKLTKQDIVQLLNKTMALMGRDLTCSETAEMDEKADELLATAQKNYDKDKSASVMELLTSEEAAVAAQIDTKNDSYMLNLSENPDYLSTVPANKRDDYIVDSLARNRKFIGVEKAHTGNTVDVGIAFGKIGDTEYIVLLQGH